MATVNLKLGIKGFLSNDALGAGCQWNRGKVNASNDANIVSL